MTAEQLTALYETQRNFASEWKQATKAAVKAGFIRPEDGKHLQAVPNETAVMP